MTQPFLITVEFPHDWHNGYSYGADTLEEARAKAADDKRGTPGENGYKQVRIYSLIAEVN